MARASQSERGRKPQGPYRRNSTVMTVRMRPDLKAAIEALAARSGHSTGQEVMMAIAAWLAQRDKEGVAHVATMADLLSQSVKRIRRAKTANDSVTTFTLQVALNHLLSAWSATQKGKQK